MNLRSKVLFLVLSVIISILIIPINSTAQENMTICQDNTYENEIPCYEITPVLNCSEYIYNITNLTDGNNSLLIENGNLSAIGDGTYTYNFSYGVGEYGVILCDGTSGKFDVLPQTQYLFLALIIISFILIAMSLFVENNIFGIFAGVLIFIGGFYFYFNNPVITNSFLDNAIQFILWAIGGYLIISNIIEIIFNTYGGIEG